MKTAEEATSPVILELAISEFSITAYELYFKTRDTPHGVTGQASLLLHEWG